MDLSKDVNLTGKTKTQKKTVQSEQNKPKIVRLTTELHKLTNDMPKYGLQPQPQTPCEGTKFLRPAETVNKDKQSVRNAEKTKSLADRNSYRVVHVEKNQEMWNKVFSEHREMSPFCHGFISWHMPSEKIRGLGCRECAKCDTCRYKSAMFNLYEDVPNPTSIGRKSATVNQGLQIGLSQTPIATAGFRKVCLSANIPAPAATSLQKSANKVLDKIKNVNMLDMKRRGARLIEINKHRGLENPNNIHVQCDGMYNNMFYNGIGKTPFQPATQTVYSVAENATSKHEIIALATKNKLCSKNMHLKYENAGHKCLSENCSANISFQKSIGDEYTWAKECFNDLKKDNLNVAFVTSDPDSSAYKAAEDLHKNVQHSIDTRHLSENHRKNMKKNIRLLKIMPGNTKAIREKNRNNFSLDLAHRCSAEFSQAYSILAGDFSKISSKLMHTVDTVLKCYLGDHEYCRKNSYVCRGGGNNWIKKSSFLSDSFTIKDTLETRDILRQCIDYRLSPKMLSKTKLNANTQKVEGLNRALRSSLPKNVTFSRNVSGRAHSAVFSVNNGSGEAILKLSKELGCDIPEGGKVYNALKDMQKRNESQKVMKKHPKYKKTRAEKRTKLFKLYADTNHKSVLFPPRQCDKYFKGPGAIRLAFGLKIDKI